MSEETKDTPKQEKPKFTRDLVARQIAQTTRELQYFQDQVQRSIGLIDYLRSVEKSFDLQEEPKPPLEVK